MNTWEEPTIEVIEWPDIIKADEDDEKALSGLLEEE